jgi:hypothetical protein
VNVAGRCCQVQVQQRNVRRCYYYSHWYCMYAYVCVLIVWS